MMALAGFWVGSEDQDGEHLLVLQEKINTCIAFMERAEIYTAIPNARGKRPIIRKRCDPQGRLGISAR